MLAPDPPETPALDAWHETHDGWQTTDNPKTHLWFPHEGPNAVLDTIDRGCNRLPVLADPDKPTVHVNLGSHVSVGGYLHEMEVYFAAVMDVLRFARWQAETFAANQAESEDSADG